MSQNSARLGLGVAVLLAAAGIGFYFAKSDAAKVRSSSLTRQPTGEAYKGFPTPAFTEHSPSWDATQFSEEELWKYDLFTPVEVTWNPGSTSYEPKGAPKQEAVPFGLRLVALRHPEYRYRFRLLVEADSRKAADATIIIEDTQTKSMLRGKPGDIIQKDGGKIQLVGFENKAVQGERGTISRDTYVKVKDFSLNKEFELRREPTVFKDKVDAVFATESSPTPVWTAHVAGDKFENEAGSYVIKVIDFDTQSVTVAKTYTVEKPKRTEKTETIDLRPEVPKPPAPAPTPAKPASK